MCELTAVMTACTRPTHVHARQRYNTKTGGGHEVPSLAKELLAVDSWWEKEGLFTLKV